MKRTTISTDDECAFGQLGYTVVKANVCKSCGKQSLKGLLRGVPWGEPQEDQGGDGHGARPWGKIIRIRSIVHPRRCLASGVVLRALSHSVSALLLRALDEAVHNTLCMTF